MRLHWRLALVVGWLLRLDYAEVQRRAARFGLARRTWAWGPIEITHTATRATPEAPEPQEER